MNRVKLNESCTEKKSGELKSTRTQTKSRNLFFFLKRMHLDRPNFIHKMFAEKKLSINDLWNPEDAKHDVWGGTASEGHEAWGRKSKPDRKLFLSLSLSYTYTLFKKRKKEKKEGE